MSTPPYATPVHPNPARRRLLALLVSMASSMAVGCGGDAVPDVDQLVHEGPIPAPRPPRPVALERSSREPIRFSPLDGELSARLAETEGRVVDLATDGEVVWVATTAPDGARVTAIDQRGIVWSRPVSAVHTVATLTVDSGADDGDHAVAVFTPDDWWALGPDGGVLWHAPGREVDQTWPTASGIAVVTTGGSRRSLWSLTATSAELVSSHLVDDELLVPGRESDDAPRALSLRDGHLFVRSLGLDAPADVVPLDAQGLAAAFPLPRSAGVAALLLRDPPSVAMLTTDPDPKAVVYPLQAPVPTTKLASRAIAIHHRRLFVATTAGVHAFDLTTDLTTESTSVTLSVAPGFDGSDLAAPLSGPR